MKRNIYLLVILVALLFAFTGCGKNVAMKECPYCEKDIDAEAKFCPNCGGDLSANNNAPSGSSAYAVGDVISFGKYEQDNNMNNGTEDIEWYVLELSDDGMVLIAVNVLDTLPYEDLVIGCTWEESPLRKWLNEDFYNNAFSENEKQRILLTHLVNENNPYYETNGGNDTDDKVFCLSLADTEKYCKVGVDEWRRMDEQGDTGLEYSKLFYDQNPMILAKPTVYAQSKDSVPLSKELIKNFTQSWGYDSKDYYYAEGAAWWWLRSPGDEKSYAAIVQNLGGASYSGYSSVAGRGGIRPVIKISY